MPIQKEYLKEMVKMSKQIDAEKLINTLVSKIAQLELENAKLKVLIDTEVEDTKGGSE